MRLHNFLRFCSTDAIVYVRDEHFKFHKVGGKHLRDFAANVLRKLGYTPNFTKIAEV